MEDDMDNQRWDPAPNPDSSPNPDSNPDPNLNLTLTPTLTLNPNPLLGGTTCASTAPYPYP